MTRSGWHFQEMAPWQPRADPIHQEFFKEQTKPDSLVREAIQNSLDQRLPTETKVMVSIWVSGERYALRPERAARYLEGLAAHLPAVEGLQTPDRGARMPFLRIEDFGTTGLVGDPADVDGSDQNNHFFWFWRNEGRTGKRPGKRGSRGVGKWVFPGSSRIRAFFGFTIPLGKAEPMLMGKAVLTVHSIDNVTYDWYGFFCSLRDDRLQLPVSDAEVIESFRRDFEIQRTAPGLSIVVPYPEAVDGAQLIQEVVQNYFLPILRGELVVEIRNIDQRTRIDRETVRSFATGTTAAMIDLATRSTALLEEERIGLEAPAVVWDKSTVPDETAQVLRSRLQSSGWVALRISVPVEKRTVGKVTSYFDAFVARAADDVEPEDCYIRQGITIAGQKRLRQRGLRGLLVVEDGPLAELMRDSEGPSHRYWTASDERVTQRYRDGDRVVKFVVNSLRELGDLLIEKPKGRAPDLLAHIFSIPAEGTREPTKSNRPTPPPPPRPPRRPRTFEISRIREGFAVTLATDQHAPRRGTLRVAYDMRRGNPFSHYKSYDFQLTLAPIQLHVRSGTVSGIRDNELDFEAQAADFRIEITGFDGHRDLRTQVSEVSM